MKIPIISYLLFFTCI